MEDQSKYIRREGFEGKSELFRIYYNPSGINMDIFLWMENYAIEGYIKNGFTAFKALPSESLGPIQICKN